MDADAKETSSNTRSHSTVLASAEGLWGWLAELPHEPPLVIRGAEAVCLLQEPGWPGSGSAEDAVVSLGRG